MSDDKPEIPDFTSEPYTSQTPSSLVKMSVNRFGELHLDKHRTDILLRWLLFLENHVTRQEILVLELFDLMSKIPEVGQLIADKIPDLPSLAKKIRNKS